MFLLNVLTLLSSLFLLAIGIFVFVKRGRTLVNTSFVLLALGFGLWSLSLFFYGNPISFDSLNWLRVVYAVGHIVVWMILFFGYAFPFQRDAHKKLTKVLSVIHLLLTPPVFYLLWFTELYVRNVTIQNENPVAEMGSFYLPYGAYCSVIVVVTTFFLVQKYKLAEGIPKLQLRIFASTLPATAFPIIVVDVILPIFFNNTAFYSNSPIALVFLIGGIAYTVLRYRFLEIRFIAGNVAYFLLSSLIPYSLFFGIAALFQLLFGSVFEKSAYFLAIPVALGFTYLFVTLRRGIKSFLRRRYIHIAYDPVEVRDKFVRATSTELDIEKIVIKTLGIFSNCFKVEKSGVVLFTLDDRKILYKRLKGFGDNGTRDLLEVILYWRALDKSCVLVLEELERLPKPENDELAKRLERVIHYMGNNDVAVILPLNRKVQLNGLCLVGYKPQKDSYTVQDIDLLMSIVSNASVAMGRAILHKQVQEFSQTLQQKVDAQTKELSDKVLMLQEAAEKERRMIDILGHELRTPITIIKSAVGIIESKRRDNQLTDEDFDINIDRMNEGIERAQNKVETMLTAAKLDGGKITLNKVAVDMMDVIGDAVFAQKALADKQGLYLKFNKPEKWESYPKGYADRDRIQEIVDNLVNNAVKYTEKGGVTIDVEHDEGFDKLTSSNYITVHVKDTGPGIPKDEIPHLGERFYRVEQYLGSEERDGPKLVRPGGTGLGLYVTFELVKLHEGKIWVDSEVGKGSTFHVSVPLFKGQKEAELKEPKEHDMFKRMGLKSRE